MSDQLHEAVSKLVEDWEREYKECITRYPVPDYKYDKARVLRRCINQLNELLAALSTPEKQPPASELENKSHPSLTHADLQEAVRKVGKKLVQPEREK